VLISIKIRVIPSKDKQAICKVENMAHKKSNESSNSVLVWSDDQKDKCKVCGAVHSQCRCKQIEAPLKQYKFVAVFRLEKKGRGGKEVTIIDQLPKSELFLKDLTKELKSKCGSGGTYLMDGKEGVIEIQGDKRAQIKTLFEKRGFKFKGM
jgi:translation initiation factor 1